MDVFVRDMPDLELALLRRGVGELSVECERCHHCHRTPLVGERVYVCAPDSILCELSRDVERDEPVDSRIVHGPEFGHTMRVSDQRPASRGVRRARALAGLTPRRGPGARSEAPPRP